MWSAAVGVRPGSESNESAWFGSDVTEWFVSGPAQVQVTVSPCAIVTAVGLNAKFLIDTSAALAGAAAAPSARRIAGITANRGASRIVPVLRTEASCGSACKDSRANELDGRSRHP